MDILSMLQMLDQADSINRIGQNISQQVQSGREGLANFFGDTKTMVDEGDASEYTVMDEKAFNDRMGNIAKASAGLSQMPEIKPGVLSPQVMSSPAPMGQAPNPYAPVNYGTMPYQEGGIGRAPSMEEILKALQSRGQ